MKKIVGLWVYLLIMAAPAFSQVDTSYIYNTAMPYGTLDLRIKKSDTRYYYLQENVTFSFRESAPGVKTNTFRDMTSWNSDPYKQGNLREKNGTQDLFVMNYRLLFPNNYDPNYDPGYPIIIMLHGYGERGNCWNDNCYWSTTGWNPNTNSPAAPTSETHNLLNNDHNLLHGGLKHLDAVKLAGNRLPHDPTMPDKAFPGFVLFPQVLNGWQQTQRVEDAIKLLRLVIKKYNIDENRVYIHALSNGGGGLFQAIKRAPWLFAAALPMSAVSNGGIFNDGMAKEVGKIPLWIFQGGKDQNPTPSRTYNTVKGLREAGASIRYSLYPHLGHGTWNTAYNEPDFFPWILKKRKYNPHVYYGNPVICNTNGAGVRISFSNGFFAYQWERDGEIITGANASEYVAQTPGSYRGRFSRVANPSESDWEPWSDPIVVTEISPAKPTITALGTTHLRGPGLVTSTVNNTVQLKSDQQAELYLWYKNGVQIDFPGTDVNDTLRIASFTSAGTGANGIYTLKTSYSYCPSPASDPVYLFFNNSAPQNMAINAASADFKGVAMKGGIFLSWNDLVTAETAYEIWRKKSGDADFKFAGRAAKNAISFFDGPLEPNSTYQYKLRAVGNSGASNYLPSNDLAVNLVVSTPGDAEKPLPPQDLKVTLNTINSLTLSWKAPADNTGIKSYIISYGTQTISTPSNATSFTVSDLPANTVYPVTVKAVDHAGNISEASNQIIGSTYVLGLFYKHSTGGWEDLDDTTLVATWIDPEFTGTVSNFTLAPRTQEDFFNFMFTGYIDIPTDGPYVFRLTSNDGSRLLIDNALAIENDGVHGNVTKLSDTLTLSKGPHRVELQYFDYAGSQTLTLQYKGADLLAGFKAVPDSLLRSGKYIAPAPPAIPSGLSAQGSGLERVDLTWSSTGDAVEVHRATDVNGPFIVIGNSSSGAFVDTLGLKPGTTYFYKGRTLAANSMSDFAAVVSASTLTDNIPPSTPANVTISNKTHTSAAIIWSASSDNAGVSNYEVYVNGVLQGVTDIPAYMITGLEPGTNYTLSVKAVDASNNKSASSVGIALATNPAAIYYSTATGNLGELTTWKQFSNGTGNSPTDFAENGLVFVIANRTTTGLGGPWDISGSASKVVVPSGVTLTIDNQFTGKVELEGTATLNLNHASVPSFGKVSATSTVVVNAPSSIPATTYGNLSFVGSGVKSLDIGNTTVLGNLSIAATTTLKGAAANGSVLVVAGNITQASQAPIVAADNRIDVFLTDNVAHSITSTSDLYFYRITTGANASVTFSPSASPLRLTVGSLNGGGLNLNANSLLDIGSHLLNIIGAGAVNPDNQTGQIGITSGKMNVESTAASSNLYFHPTRNIIDSLTVNLSSGQAVMRSPVIIEGALIIGDGTFDGGGNVTLKATEIRTASLGQIGDGGQYAGNLIVQQYIPYIKDQRIELSGNVQGISVANWQLYFPITGSFSGASNGSSEASMFSYNGNAFTPYPIAGGSNAAPIEMGKGYQAYISNTTPFVLETIGHPYQGAIDIPLNVNASGSAGTGWTLIGNPFPSPIVWSDSASAIVKSGLTNAVAMRENSIIDGVVVGRYQYYSPELSSATVPAGKAFWVRSYNSTPSLFIKEAAKGAVQYSPSSEVPHVNILLKQGNKQDVTYILFKDGATNAFDGPFDLPKLQNDGLYNLSSIADGVSLAVNALSKSFCSTAVSLNISNAAAGNYVLSFTDIATLEQVGQATIRDNFANTTVSLNTDYAFSITSDPASTGASRFVLTFTRSALDITTPKANGVPLCSNSAGQINITDSQPGVLYTPTFDGQTSIGNTVEGNGETITVEVASEKLQQGDNLVKILAAFAGCNSSMLQSQATINYSGNFEINVQDDVSVCTGNTAQLVASGAPANGAYRWYDDKGNVLPGQNTATLTTQPVQGELTYQVSGVLANGCETLKKTIHVYPDTLKTPVITMYRDTLFAQVDAQFQWYRNGNAIAGASQSYFVPKATGNYTVIATSSGCSKESLPYTHVIDPACVLDTSLPQVSLVNTECGPETYIISISASSPEVAYGIIDANDELLSELVPGNNSALMLNVASSSLDSGINRLRVRVDKAGCINRTLDDEVDVNNIPPMPKPVIVIQNGELVVETEDQVQWYLEGQMIPGATELVYRPTKSGNYSVKVSDELCESESDPLNYLFTGLEMAASELQLDAYPVPSTSKEFGIRVQSPNATPIVVQLIDMTGRVIFTKLYEPRQLISKVSLGEELPNGLYTVIVMQNGAELRKRIIIQN